MTTSVVIAVNGNKEVEVSWVNAPDSIPIRLQPGCWVTRTIHGELGVTVKEVGEFIKDTI